MTSQQRSLFGDQSEPFFDESEIVGLRYIPDFINREQHDELVRQIDSEPWLTDLKRRVQHYGYKYNYKSRSVDQSMRIGPLPIWAANLGEMLRIQGHTSESPDQVIVNEYQPGQGIANHIDCVPCFADTIISLSLGSACVMELTNKKTGKMVPLLLEPRSLVVLKEDARFIWTHGIPARKNDKLGERTISRRRRVSLTFRKMILQSGMESTDSSVLPVLMPPQST
ncbi:MAG: alpha-ketoglutarate-dependent dioxygenase AlkB [Planctomycetota bacterium]